jgi:hypothetical protein
VVVFSILMLHGFFPISFSLCTIVFVYFYYNISLISATSATRYYSCIFALTVTFPYSMFLSVMLHVLWNIMLELNIKASAIRNCPHLKRLKHAYVTEAVFDHHANTYLNLCSVIHVACT